MPAYRLVTLGCKVSRADAAGVERALLDAGLVSASDERAADLCVVCGCAVTAVAEGKSRRAMRRLARENPGATVVAAGCMGERQESSRDAGAHVLVGPDDVPRFLERLRELDRWRDLGERDLRADATAGRGWGGRTRAFLKVQDGCDGACAYCIVPSLRGPPRSVPVGEVMDEAGRLVDSGHAEIVLAGVRLGAYLYDGANLAALVEKLLCLEARGLARLRLSSIEPMDLSRGNERLVEIAASSGVLCPHFHLPVQSGDDEVLARMNRPYRTADFRALVDGLRSRLANPAITTDVIAGFPGETEEAHARSVEFVKEIGFARVHAFPFSLRPGTPAAEMAHEPGTEAARRRTSDLIDAGREAAREFRRHFIGKTANVLAEPGGKPGRLAGYTERYVRVVFDGRKELAGRIVRVHNLLDAGDHLEGELAP